MVNPGIAVINGLCPACTSVYRLTAFTKASSISLYPPFGSAQSLDLQAGIGKKEDTFGIPRSRRRTYPKSSQRTEGVDNVRRKQRSFRYEDRNRYRRKPRARSQY